VAVAGIELLEPSSSQKPQVVAEVGVEMMGRVESTRAEGEVVWRGTRLGADDIGEGLLPVVEEFSEASAGAGTIG
jgi:hypothetical protein